MLIPDPSVFITVTTNAAKSTRLLQIVVSPLALNDAVNRSPQRSTQLLR